MFSIDTKKLVYAIGILCEIKVKILVINSPSKEYKEFCHVYYITE